MLSHFGCLSCMWNFSPSQIFKLQFFFYTAFSCSSLYSKYKFRTFALKSSFQIYMCLNVNNVNIFSFPKKMVLKPHFGFFREIHLETLWFTQPWKRNDKYLLDLKLFFLSFQFTWLCNLGIFTTNQSPEHWRFFFWVLVLALSLLRILDMRQIPKD